MLQALRDPTELLTCKLRVTARAHDNHVRADLPRNLGDQVRGTTYVSAPNPHGDLQP